MPSMNPEHGQPRRKISSLIVSLILLFSSVQLFSSSGQAEIPHENYDLIRSDLDAVIALLNSSIRASERAFMDMYNMSMDAVDQDLRLVEDVIEPASKLVDKIINLAESYRNLSELLPPFVALSSEEQDFASMEREFLGIRARLLEYADQGMLTSEEHLAALGYVARGRALIASMNSTIDEMLVYANEINALTVENSYPFLPNDMIPLIEKLRELLIWLSIEFEEIIHRIHWNETLPFLILWIKDRELYLGETVIGGGYLFFNGSFRSGRNVEIRIDGDIRINTTTGDGGRYSFSFEIPIDAAWLGLHRIQSFAFTGWQELSSNIVTIEVSLIPTTIQITVDKTLLAPNEDLSIRTVLRDVYGRGVKTANCVLLRDSSQASFSTDEKGVFSTIWKSSEIGLGTHTIQAKFLGELPYAPSDSGLVTIIVNIPTRITLTLSSDKYPRGSEIHGQGALYANYSEPLAGKTITLILDDRELMNLTTDVNGTYRFSINSANLSVGAHRLVAAFLYRESIWRYCQAEAVFEIFEPPNIQPYPFTPFLPYFPFFPFFPILPGAGGSGGGSIGDFFKKLLEDLKDLFFGKYALLTWLLIVVIILIIIRTWQLRKKSRRAAAETVETIAEPAVATEMSPEKEHEKPGVRPPENPNDKIVWYYNYLLRTLTSRRMIKILDSMTHWEIAGLLKSLGYPIREIENVTILFELAFYSGKPLTDSDAQSMEQSVQRLDTGGVPVAG